MKAKSIVVVVLLILGMMSCQKNESDLPSIKFNNQLEQSLVSVDLDLSKQSSTFKAAEDWWVTVNKALAVHNIQLEKMETYGAEKEGVNFYFKGTGNKQLDSDFVPDDPRNGTGIDVPYAIDGTELGTSSGMSESETHNAIMSAMNTWDEITCSSGLNIPYIGTTSVDYGFVQWLLGFGGYPGYFLGWIFHGGILPAAFFEALEPDGGQYILGVTFTYVYSDDDNNMTDIDNNGKADVAIKEIYINEGFNWKDAPDDGIGNGIYDFETVVTHEVGHGLSQAHFGKAFRAADGKLKFAPAALMNNAYTGARREVTKSDLAGHCSIWGDWPQN